MRFSKPELVKAMDCFLNAFADVVHEAPNVFTPAIDGTSYVWTKATKPEVQSKLDNDQSGVAHLAVQMETSWREMFSMIRGDYGELVAELHN